MLDAIAWQRTRVSPVCDFCAHCRDFSQACGDFVPKWRGAAVRLNSLVSSGYVGILSVELHFPAAASLKGKRKYVKSAKAQLQNRFGAAVAEVDHHDLWQRSRLTVACVARGHTELQQLLDGAERYLNGQEWELVRVERQVVDPDE